MTKEILNNMAGVDFSDLAQEFGTNFKKIKNAAAQKQADDLVFFNEIKESQRLLKKQITKG